MVVYGKGLRALAAASIILRVGVLVTGSIWAEASWGHWWVWDEPTLVSFLIVFLLYCTYPPLRFSIEDSERQARYASVFAIAAGGARCRRRGRDDGGDPHAAGRRLRCPHCRSTRPGAMWPLRTSHSRCSWSST